MHLLSLTRLLIALASALGDGAFNMSVKPSNRVIHMCDMLALKAESREVSHATSSRIVGQLWTIGSRNPDDLHADGATTEMGTAFGTAEACIDTSGCQGISVVHGG